jgi:hypothetical protein
MTALALEIGDPVAMRENIDHSYGNWIDYLGQIDDALRKYLDPSTISMHAENQVRKMRIAFLDLGKPKK